MIGKSFLFSCYIQVMNIITESSSGQINTVAYTVIYCVPYIKGATQNRLRFSLPGVVTVLETGE